MKKVFIAIVLGFFMVSASFAVGVTGFNWGIEHSTIISAAHALNTVLATGGSEQYIITTNASAVTFEAKWYKDNGTTLITTEPVAQNTMLDVKTKKVIFYAYPTSTVSTPEIYIYGR